MSKRDCDLDELLRFQIRTAQYFMQVQECGQRLIQEANHASSLLRDKPSQRTLDQVTQLGTMLSCIALHAADDMQACIMKTRQDLDRLRELS